MNVGFAVILFLAAPMAKGQDLASASTPVDLQMRQITMHLDGFTVLEIKTLRGQMLATRHDRPISFDDANSFVTRINTAEAAISLKTISDLLNRRVFAYPGAPLKRLALQADGGRIKQTGIMHKGVDIPFELEGTMEARDGEIRLHAEKIRAAHLPVKGLLRLFGEDLSKLINIKQDRGVSLDHDDIVLRPERMLPPPRMEGTLAAVRLEGDRIVLSFRSRAVVKDLNPPQEAQSYIYHRGGVLRFGKLTMTDSDLEIVSESGHTPLDFSFPEYDRQLTAGYSKNTPAHGLIVFMKDYFALPPASATAHRGG